MLLQEKKITSLVEELVLQEMVSAYGIRILENEQLVEGFWDKVKSMWKKNDENVIESSIKKLADQIQGWADKFNSVFEKGKRLLGLNEDPTDINEALIREAYTLNLISKRQYLRSRTLNESLTAAAAFTMWGGAMAINKIMGWIRDGVISVFTHLFKVIDEKDADILKHYHAKSAGPLKIADTVGAMEDEDHGHDHGETTGKLQLTPEQLELYNKNIFWKMAFLSKYVEHQIHVLLIKPIELVAVGIVRCAWLAEWLQAKEANKAAAKRGDEEKMGWKECKPEYGSMHKKAAYNLSKALLFLVLLFGLVSHLAVAGHGAAHAANHAPSIAEKASSVKQAITHAWHQIETVVKTEEFSAELLTMSSKQLIEGGLVALLGAGIVKLMKKIREMYDESKAKLDEELQKLKDGDDTMGLGGLQPVTVEA